MGLNYKSFGEGEAIIILHGLFGMLDNWQSFGKALSEEYRVLLVDQRNHGKSYHTNEFSYPLLAQDLNIFMEDLNLPHAHIMGHSMGGKTAMTFASKYPDLVKSLIVVDIAPKQYQGGHEAIFKAILNIDINNVASRKEVNEQLLLSIPDIGVRLFLMKNLTRNPEGGYKWKANFKALYNQYPSIMGNDEYDGFMKSSLFIKGGNSDYILQEDERIIKTLFPKAELIEVQGVGHWVHAEKPAELKTIVQQFLNEVQNGNETTNIY